MSSFEEKKSLLFKHLDGTGDWASYKPLLISALLMSDGPILELGLGLGSTPMLQDFSSKFGVQLWSFDNNNEWAKQFSVSNSQVIICDADPSKWIFDKIFSIPKWSVALVDHAPGHVRYEAAIRLANICDYVIMNDTEPFGAGDYHWDRVKPYFSHWVDDSAYGAWTSIASNYKDLSFCTSILEGIQAICYKEKDGNLQRKM